MVSYQSAQSHLLNSTRMDWAMRQWQFYFRITLVCLLVGASASLDHLRGGRRADESLTCRVLHVDEFMIEDGDHLECQLVPSGHSYAIDLSESFVRANTKALRRGDLYIHIPGGTIEETFIEGYGTIGARLVIPDPSVIVTIPPPTASQRQRKLAATGVRTLMVVRVSTADATPGYTASQLQSYYFSATDFSVARQYHRCSSGLLTFTAYSTPVLDINVGGSIGSFTRETLVNAALTEVENRLGVGVLSTINHHAMILPSGVQGAVWFAVGQTGAGRTIFNNTFGGIPNTAMHELGHNLGLGHSGIPGDVYGDLSSVMGYGDYRQFQPSKCFNGYDHFNLQWFTDRTLVIDPTLGPQGVRLATFVDYSLTSPSQPVVVRVGNWFLTYNKAKGVNFEVDGAPNQVTVELGDPAVGASSTRMGALDETTAPFLQPNFGGGSSTLNIQVCQRDSSGGVDFAVVVIALQTISCARAFDGTIVFPAANTPVSPPTPRPAQLRPTNPPVQFSASGAVFINCGSKKSFRDSKGNIWAADAFFSGGGAISTATAINNSVDDDLFKSARYGQTIYNIPVPSGNYQVDVYFAEISPFVKTVGTRVFDVLVEGSVAFDNVDIMKRVGRFTALKLSTTMYVADGVLNIRLATQALRPIISGISARIL